MPNIRLLNQISKKLNSVYDANDEDLQKLIEETNKSKELSMAFYTKVDRIRNKYGFENYFEKVYQAQNNDTELPEDERITVNETNEVGRNASNLHKSIQKYLKEHEKDKDQKKVNAVKEILALAEQKYRNDTALSVGLLLKTTKDKDFEAVYDGNALEEENDLELNDGNERNGSQLDIDYEPALDESQVYLPKKASSIDSVMAEIKKYEQFTGSFEYTSIMHTMDAIRISEKRMRSEMKKQKDPVDIEDYNIRLQDLAEEKKDMLCAVNHYLNRKNDEKNAAEAKNKKESTNSKNRRKAMEKLQKILIKDIAEEEKRSGVDPDKEIYSSIRRELEFGESISFGGSDKYHKVLENAKKLEELGNKAYNYDKRLKAEADLLQSMDDYLGERVGAQKKANGYKFSLNDGKDGKKLEGSNNTERRYQIMAKSMIKLGNHLAQEMNSIRLGNTKNEEMAGKFRRYNNKYGFNINTGKEIDKPKNIYEAQFVDAKKLNDLKNIAIDAEISIRKDVAAKQKDEMNRRKLWAEEFKINNPDNDYENMDYMDVYNNYYPGKVDNKNLADYTFNAAKNDKINAFVDSAVDLIYANSLKKTGNFDYDAYEAGKEEFRENLNETEIGKKFRTNCSSIFNLNKNTIAQLRNDIDDDAVKGWMDLAVEKVFKAKVKDAERSINRPNEDTQEKVENVRKVLDLAAKLNGGQAPENLDQAYQNLVEKANPDIQKKAQIGRVMK